MKSHKSVALVAILALIIPLTPLYSASAKTPKPTLKEIREAKEKEAAKKREADKAQAKLNAANKTLKQLTAVANAAQAKYVKAKAELAGGFGRSLEQPGTVANFALNTARYNLPKDYYATYLKKLNSFTVADINATAKRLIEPDKFIITTVGNGSEIKEKLAQFGEVVEYDIMGEPAKQLVADANMTAEKVLENYLNAIGGADKVSAIKSAKISM
ncbi:MAG: insulinase family protein, partial [Actinobacteria bacterium]|nr:insulinase family protein [Actinomycetota bacterium]